MRTYQLSALIRVEMAASSSVSARMDHSRCIKTLPSSQSDNISAWIANNIDWKLMKTKYSVQSLNNQLLNAQSWENT